MAIQYKKDKNEIIIYIIGELDYDHGEKLYELIEKNCSLYNKIVINLERVKYINFEGLERLVDINNLMKDKKFLIEKIHSNIKEILKKIGLITLLPIGK